MRRAARAILAAALLAATPARAGDPASTFSIHARPAALGGAAMALDEATSAPLHNPAAAALADGLSVKLGYMFSLPLLSYNGARADVEGVHGLSLAAAVPLLDRRVGGRRLRMALGLGLFVPDRWIARIYLIEPTRPSFVMWEGAVNRITAAPVLALALGDLVSIGAGATLLTDGAAMAELDLGFEGSQTRTDASVDLQLRLRAAPLVGIRIRPFRWVTLAGGYSGELSMDLALDVHADLDAPGLEGYALVSIRGTNDYTPPTAWASVAVHPAPWLDLLFQATYVMWHRANPFYADLRMLVDLGEGPSALGDLAPDGKLQDRWVIAAGLEGRIPVLAGCTLALRGGYQYRPTPVPEQTGWTSYADSDVHLASAGLGFATWKDRAVQLRVAWAVQMQRIVERTVGKEEDVFIVDSYTIEGWVLASMLDVELTFR
jgi:long-subunit fatty acid transport protein